VKKRGLREGSFQVFMGVSREGALRRAVHQGEGWPMTMKRKGKLPSSGKNWMSRRGKNKEGRAPVSPERGTIKKKEKGRLRSLEGENFSLVEVLRSEIRRVAKQIKDNPMGESTSLVCHCPEEENRGKRALIQRNNLQEKKKGKTLLGEGTKRRIKDKRKKEAFDRGGGMPFARKRVDRQGG